MKPKVYTYKQPYLTESDFTLFLFTHILTTSKCGSQLSLMVFCDHYFLFILFCFLSVLCIITTSFQIMPCRNFQIATGLGMVAFYGYLQFHLGDRPRFPEPPPFIDHLEFSPTFSESLCRNPTSNSSHPFGTFCQSAFPKGCSNFHSHQQRVRMPAQPPSAQTGGSGLDILSLSARKAGEGFVRDARMMTPDPEPQEWVLTSPVPRTEPAEKRKSKQAGKTLSAGKHTHTYTD